MEYTIKILSESDLVKYYPCQCQRCGWTGSSQELNGGRQIADTGDYDDACCPICNSKSVDEVDNILSFVEFIEACRKAFPLLKTATEKIEENNLNRHIEGYYKEQNEKLIEENNRLRDLVDIAFHVAHRCGCIQEREMRHFSSDERANDFIKDWEEFMSQHSLLNQTK